jgi:ElaB/YqjD/DUF883 family membrane-anchored ribosome-binding protein
MSDHRSPERIEADIERTREEMSETLDAIQQKLSPGRMVDDVMQYFKSSNPDDNFTVNLVDSIKRNPIPIALVGVGLGWLMMSGDKSSNGHNRGSYGYRNDYPDTSTGYRYGSAATSNYGGNRVYGSPSSVTGGASYATGTGSNTGSSGSGSSIGDSMSSTAHNMKDKAGSAVDSAQQKLNEGMNKVSDTAHQVGQQVSDKAHQVGQQVSDGAGYLQQKAQDGMDELQYRAEEAATAARYQMHRQAENIQDGFNYLLREQPLVLIGMGVALGAALGAGLPSTRREDELMGESSDQLKSQATAMGKEQLHKAEAVAGAAAGAAMDQVDQEHVDGSGLKETVNKAKESAERIAGAAKEAAEKEANKQGVTGSSNKSSDKNGKSDNNGSKKK